MPEASSFGIVDLYIKGWELLKQVWRKALPVGLVFFVIQVLVQVSVEYAQEQQIGSLMLLISLVSLVVGVILQSGIIAVGLRLLREKTAEINDLFAQRDVWLNFFLASLGYQLLIFFGLILLVVPGVYWMIKYSQVLFLIVDKKMGVSEAFSVSGRMTKGVMTKLLGFWLLAIPLNIAGLLALGVGLLVTLPVTGFAQLYLYQMLLERPESSEMATSQSTSSRPTEPMGAPPTMEAKTGVKSSTSASDDSSPPPIKL